LKLTDEKRAELVRKALQVLTRGGVVTRIDCFGDTDNKPLKNWTRKIMLRFVTWNLATALPREREGETSQFMVKNVEEIGRILEDPEGVADFLWGEGPSIPTQSNEKPDLPGEMPPESTGPQPFVPPASTEPPTTEETLAEVLGVMRQFGDLLIWMKDTMQRQGKKINEMHAILEQLK
jgi:hypothetical protein